MNIILFCIALVIGWIIGYVSNSLFTTNKHIEDCSDAFESGKAFERMRISKDENISE